MTTHIDISRDNNSIVSLCGRGIGRDSFQWGDVLELAHYDIPGIDCTQCLKVVSCLKQGLTLEAAFAVANDKAIVTMRPVR